MLVASDNLSQRLLIDKIYLTHKINKAFRESHQVASCSSQRDKGIRIKIRILECCGGKDVTPGEFVRKLRLGSLIYYCEVNAAIRVILAICILWVAIATISLV